MKNYLITILLFLLSSCTISLDNKIKVYRLLIEEKTIFIPVEINKISYKFVLDLNCPTSTISKTLAEKLKLQPTKNNQEYEIDFMVFGDLTLNNIIIKANNNNSAGTIGRDLLGRTSFLYLNLKEKYFNFNKFTTLTKQVALKKLTTIDPFEYMIFSIDFKNNVIHY